MSEPHYPSVEGSARREAVSGPGYSCRDGGEWDFRSGEDWAQRGAQGAAVSGHLPTPQSSEKSCLCSELAMSKALISIFILFNLTMIAVGGVVFTLGLSGYWTHRHLAHLITGSSCLMCWGTLATTFDTLALLGIVQVSRDQIFALSEYCEMMQLMQHSVPECGFEGLK